MLIIDCGACIGKFLRDFLEHEVHAFEPLQKNVDYLKRRYPGIKVMRNAVTGTSGDKIKLYLHEDPKHRNRAGSMGSSIFATKTNVMETYFEEVETIALSDYITALGRRVNLLKIDTEGTEFVIFEDLLNTGMIHHIDIIYYEDHRERHPEMFDLDWAAAVEQRLKSEFKGKLVSVDF